MKLANKRFLHFFSFLTVFLFLYNCKSTVGEFYYNDRTEKTEYEKMDEETYLNDVPKQYQKTDKDILVIFNGEAFKGKKIVINNKDSITFKIEPGSSGCYGATSRKINKSLKKIKLSVEGKKDIIIPFIEKYDYIEIGDAYDKTKWGIQYNKIFPSYSCM
ncbi:hypothetical protein [Chryseobacterium sp. ERMR1:04]|uniref:hypothetical protein n=1 Tax=Chryseobacterium sp. ERMR1:04 TaxID=1705393 RepID=UPI0006C84476|nr:hypothetical protein [Chryseobacterium sp. ERMR1:04]KPH14110.1 hypothetical protein AMQ68_00870 [Chryseobacterium sp. ERMR1:04]